ncbi:hypothetical protein HK102_005618 [Quaeritorhiza haematococci]|nr:hypothetical protein HK102_005618 [Quaeritorhiza haematococci]
MSSTAASPKRKIDDLTFSDTFTRDLPPDPLTPTGPPIVQDVLNSPVDLTPPSKPSTSPNQKSATSTSPSASSPTDSVVRTSRVVLHAAYTYLTPEPCPAPLVLLGLSKPACSLLDFDPPDAAVPGWQQSDGEKDTLTEVVVGNTLLKGSKPWCHAYAGHQFGVYAGQLGDGRCISLGEIVRPPPPVPTTPAPIPSPSNFAFHRQHDRWELQLKGAGRTPFSRFGDGYCAFHSSLREFLCSEYMHALGVPTTRALSLVATPGRKCHRDGRWECGAVTARLAPSWVRFGSFELFWYRGDRAMVKKLADHVIRWHYPSVANAVKNDAANDGGRGVGAGAHDLPDGSKAVGGLNMYALFFREVVRNTAIMVAHWQAVGFCHGVMNTDNMSICGLTMDYGPFGFLDTYNPSWCSNASDSHRLYTFDNQPRVALYNLTKFARTLTELVVPEHPIHHAGTSNLGGSPSSKDCSGYDNVAAGEKKKVEDEEMVKMALRGAEIVKGLLGEFEHTFIEVYTELMREKLGISTQKSTDLEQYVVPLLHLMEQAGVDYTRFFRALCYFRCDDEGFNREIGAITDDDAIATSTDVPSNLAIVAPRRCLTQLIAGYKVVRARALKKAATRKAAEKSNEGGSNGSEDSSAEAGKGQAVAVSTLQASLSGATTSAPKSPSSKPNSTRPGTGKSHTQEVRPNSASPHEHEEKEDDGDVVGEVKKLSSSRMDLLRSRSTLSADSSARKAESTSQQQHEHQPLVPDEENEIRQRWIAWATAYKQRLLEEMSTAKSDAPATKSTSQAATSASSTSTQETIRRQDTQRRQRMLKRNPRYILRSWILDELIEEMENAFEPLLGNPESNTSTTSNGTRIGSAQPQHHNDRHHHSHHVHSPSKTPSQPLSVNTTSQPTPTLHPDVARRLRGSLDKVMRVLIGDVYGEIAEAGMLAEKEGGKEGGKEKEKEKGGVAGSSSGWIDFDDRRAAVKWAGEVPKWGVNVAYGASS